MDIAYLVPGPLSKGPLGTAELQRREEYLAKRAFPGTRVAVREVAGGPASVESSVEEALAVPEILRAVPLLEEEGFDAVIIGCFDDPGLAAARELTRMPIMGPAQTSCHWAGQLGDRFAMLTVVDEVIPLLRRLMRTYGLQELVADLRAVDIPVLELQHDPEAVLRILTEEGERALRTGADSIVLGCMSMGFLNVAEALEDRLKVPVVNPVLAALKAAECAVALGTTHSIRAYPPPRKATLSVA